MTDPLTLIKLIVLYMLDKVDFPLSKAQIFDFILEKEYTHYFNLQIAMHELSEGGLINDEQMHSVTLLTITDRGRDTLKYFQGRISDGIKNDITTYLQDNRVELHNEVSITTNYYRIGAGEYVAELSAREKSSELVSIKLTVPNESAAETICNNWKEQNQDIYSYLLSNLL